MAYSAISTGSVANDGTGDTLRDGATKVNNNFTRRIITTSPDVTVSTNLGGLVN